jgi:hypothetical protein
LQRAVSSVGAYEICLPFPTSGQARRQVPSFWWSLFHHGLPRQRAANLWVVGSLGNRPSVSAFIKLLWIWNRSLINIALHCPSQWVASDGPLSIFERRIPMCGRSTWNEDLAVIFAVCDGCYGCKLLEWRILSKRLGWCLLDPGKLSNPTGWLPHANCFLVVRDRRHAGYYLRCIP